MSQENKEIVEKVNASFMEGNSEGFLSFCADDIEWTMIGEKHVTSKQAIREWMKEMDGMEPPKFTVDNLIAEGETVMCNGNMTMNDKDGKSVPYGYCDIYRFRDGKIVKLDSFVVKTQAESNTENAASA
ncbi:MAG: nuclear transport factor 2 family protein [Saprospiraceae bacterium]|nr:nuclear transport factor 2 family protein [Pyrinomonadaceae bacterium]